MIIQHLINELTGPALSMPDHTVDTIKYGDASLDVRHIGICFTATAEVLERAGSAGVQFLITHEPLFYDHFDRIREQHPVIERKLGLLRRLGITVWRYHDSMHRLPTDGIIEGISHKLKWQIQPIDRQIWKFETPMTALQAAEDIRVRLHCGGVRVCGNTVDPLERIAMAEGDSGVNTKYMDQLIMSGFEGMVFIGEACEWGALEQIRDADHLGLPIAAVIIGHAASEEAGMELLSEKLRAAHPELIVDYFPTGEVYSHF